MKSWLLDNDTEIYSTHNEKESIVAERFPTTIKKKVCKYITSVSKNMYIDKLYAIINKYNTYNSAIKMKPVDVKSSTYIDSGTENNDKDPAHIGLVNM